MRGLQHYKFLRKKPEAAADVLEAAAADVLEAAAAASPRNQMPSTTTKQRQNNQMHYSLLSSINRIKMIF